MGGMSWLWMIMRVNHIERQLSEIISLILKISDDPVI